MKFPNFQINNIPDNDNLHNNIPIIIYQNGEAYMQVISKEYLFTSLSSKIFPLNFNVFYITFLITAMLII